MALQGTLDTFALPDVLRLLAATKKTGRLRITGGRGTGSVWVSSARSRPSRPPTPPTPPRPVDALFELLRFEDGAFTFDAEATPRRTRSRRPTSSSCSRQSEAHARRVARDRGRRAVDGRVGHARDAPCRSPRSPSTRSAGPPSWPSAPARPCGASATSCAWRSCPSRERSRSCPRPASSRSPPPRPLVPLPSTNGTAPLARPARGRQGRRTPAARPPEAPAARRRQGAAGPAGPRCSTARRPGARRERLRARSICLALGRRPRSHRRGPEPPSPGWPTGRPPTDCDDQELAKQLATLSPRAANAIRAAAEATTDEEREAALDEVDADDEPLNRGLLLKFLSSVKT